MLSNTSRLRNDICEEKIPTLTKHDTLKFGFNTIYIVTST